MSDTLENEDLDDTVNLDEAPEEGAEDRGDVVTGVDPEETEQSAPAEEEEPPKEEQEKSKFVPHARFNEVNEAKKAAEQRAAELEAELERIRQSAPREAELSRQVEKPVFDIDAKEAAAAEALFQGEVEQYKKIQAEIRAHMEQQATQKALEEFEQRSAARTARELLQVTADRIATKYEFLNSESPNADAQAIADVIEWRDFYIAKGSAPHVALEKAAQKIAPMYAQPESDEPEPPKVDSRRTAAVARAAAAAAAQPPAGGGIGERAASAKLDIEKMTDDQFSRLSDEDKRRLRGD